MVKSNIYNISFLFTTLTKNICACDGFSNKKLLSSWKIWWEIKFGSLAVYLCNHQLFHSWIELWWSLTELPNLIYLHGNLRPNCQILFLPIFSAIILIYGIIEFYGNVRLKYYSRVIRLYTNTSPYKYKAVVVFLGYYTQSHDLALDIFTFTYACWNVSVLDRWS